jgi:hypothetical protein
MCYTKLIMLMRLIEECQIALKSIFAFPLLNLRLHGRKIGGELEVLAIAKPDIVVGGTLYDINAFFQEGCVEIAVCFGEEVRE